jgi:hypothetical protein
VPQQIDDSWLSPQCWTCRQPQESTQDLTQR